jgi:hypothetical protein
MTKKRRRYRQTLSLDERLVQMARAAREAATNLPVGPERDLMLKKAQQAEIARSINDSLSLMEAAPG